MFLESYFKILTEFSIVTCSLFTYFILFSVFVKILIFLMEKHVKEAIIQSKKAAPGRIKSKSYATNHFVFINQTAKICW